MAQFRTALLAASVLAVLGAGMAACTPSTPAPVAAPAKPAITKTRDELAREVVELSGVRDQIRLMFQTIFASLLSDPRVLTIANEEIDLTVEQFVKEAATMWAQEFTSEELNELVTFYRSPVGRALVSKQPIIGEKMTPIGQRLGAALDQRIGQRLQAAGLTPPR